MTQNQDSANIIPEKLYITMKPIFASLVFTIPDLYVNLPEAPYIQPLLGDLTLTLKNNGKFRIDPLNPDVLIQNDPYAKSEIESVKWFGDTFSGQDVLRKRKELLEKFFVKMFEGEEKMDYTRRQLDTIGLPKGGYLYRAISKWELRDLMKEKCKFFSHIDPSANFDNETMYRSDNSQARIYYKDINDDYSGHILRWKIEDPLFYRVTGFPPALRVVPLFSHFISKEMDISSDSVNFTPFELFQPSFR